MEKHTERGSCLTYAQAQAATGINHWTLRRLVAAGVLRIVRIGHRTVHIRRDELDRVIRLFEDKPTVAQSRLRRAA